MKNSECTIYITTKHGYIQRYHKEKKGWTQTNPKGKVWLLSAEQLLSHILPSLAGIGPLSVRVEPDKQKNDGVAQFEFSTSARVKEARHNSSVDLNKCGKVIAGPKVTT